MLSLLPFCRRDDLCESIGCLCGCFTVPQSEYVLFQLFVNGRNVDAMYTATVREIRWVTRVHHNDSGLIVLLKDCLKNQSQPKTQSSYADSRTPPNRALVYAISSASVVDLAVELCFFGDQTMGIERYPFSGCTQLLKCSWPYAGMKQNQNLYIQPALEIRWGRQSPGSCGQLGQCSWSIWASFCLPTTSNKLLYLQVVALQNLSQAWPNETTKGIAWALWQHDCVTHLHTQALLQTFETPEDMESISLLLFQWVCNKTLQVTVHMSSCHRSLSFLWKFFEPYVFSQRSSSQFRRWTLLVQLWLSAEVLSRISVGFL